MRNTSPGRRDDWATLVLEGRRAARVTQRGLAEAADVARETVWRWETGKQMPENIETVKKVAKALGIEQDRALAAAKLHAGERSEAPAPDPRLRGLDPADPVVRKIMAFDIDEDMRGWMLDRHRQNLERDRQRYLDDLERDATLFRDRPRGAA